ncbi:F-box/LRR-repeat protein [Acrasis kona]|uniref:F-box/LRR-repeat protein n=1 Tax=Acrasis kona TaxID=1008807 RepID=A0AAW2YM32_9EUKA
MIITELPSELLLDIFSFVTLPVNNNINYYQIANTNRHYRTLYNCLGLVCKDWHKQCSPNSKLSGILHNNLCLKVPDNPKSTHVMHSERFRAHMRSFSIDVQKHDTSYIRILKMMLKENVPLKRLELILLNQELDQNIPESVNIPELVSSFKTLTALMLQSLKLSDDDFKLIVNGLPELTSINVWSSNRLTSGSLYFLMEKQSICDNLTQLHIGAFNSLHSINVLDVRRLHKLTSVNFSRCMFTNIMLPSSIQELNLSFMPLLASHKYLAGLSNLTLLNLKRTVTKQTIMSLYILLENINIKHLNLSGCYIDDDFCILVIQRLKNLCSLDLIESTEISSSFMFLSTMNDRLTTLHIASSVNIERDDLLHILDTCVSLTDFSCDIMKLDDDVFENIKERGGYRNIRRLHFYSPMRLSNKGFRSLCCCFPKLRVLNIESFTPRVLDEEGLLYLRMMPELEEANLSWFDVFGLTTKALLQAVEGMQHLTMVQLRCLPLGVDLKYFNQVHPNILISLYTVDKIYLPRMQ